MVKVILLSIFLISKAEAQMPSFKDSNLLDNMPGYEGTDIKEVGYKNQDMKDLANQEISNNPDGVGRYMLDNAQTRPKYDFSNSQIINEKRYNPKDGEFLKSPKYTHIIDKTYQDCKPQESAYEEQKSCNYYQAKTTQKCIANRVVEVEDVHRFGCVKEKEYKIKKCTRNLKVNVIAAEKEVLSKKHFSYLIGGDSYRMVGYIVYIHRTDWRTIGHHFKIDDLVFINFAGGSSGIFKVVGFPRGSRWSAKVQISPISYSGSSSGTISAIFKQTSEPSFLDAKITESWDESCE